jgi:hypothetical protein
MRAVGRPAAPLRVSGSVRALDDGDALRLRGCGRQLRLPAGGTLIGSPPGTVMRADRLLLHSPAPRPLARAALPAGRVLSVEGEGPLGVPERARLNVQQRSAWLVLGQSWSRGWRATCRDASGRTTELGEPVPIDGFANGWRVGPACAEVSFAFPPQKLALVGYAVSAVVFLLLLVVALAGWVRERRTADRGPRTAGLVTVPDPLIRVLDWRRVLLVAVGVAAVGGFVFALRAGAVLFFLTLIALRVGINVRRLVALALAAVALLPLIYLIFQPKDRGGFAFSYANDLLGAHWVAAFAIACFAVAAGLTAWRWRSGLDGADHAVPGDELADERDARDEREPRPVARLDPRDA